MNRIVHIQRLSSLLPLIIKKIPRLRHLLLNQRQQSFMVPLFAPATLEAHPEPISYPWETQPRFRLFLNPGRFSQGRVSFPQLPSWGVLGMSFGSRRGGSSSSVLAPFLPSRRIRVLRSEEATEVSIGSSAHLHCPPCGLSRHFT